jgi:hypothetical protein
MAFHIPFDQRYRGQPIYIGFDTPPVPRRRWNWWGFFGFGLSLFSFLTAGFLSPLALLLNLVGMRREPRGLARAGMVLSLVGMALAGGVIAMGVTSYQRAQAHHQELVLNARNRELGLLTGQTLQVAQAEFAQYREVNGGNLPQWIDANMVAIKHKDAWGESLRFDIEKEGALLRSAGPDREFDTSDDLTLRVEGKSQRSLSGEI